MDLDQKIAALKKLPAGFALTPVKNKIPFLTAWEKTDTTRDEIAAYLSSGQATGFGLRTGIPSGGICAIDIDGTAAQCKLIDVMGDEEMPPTIAFASGKPDRAQYLFLVPQDLWDTLKTKSEKITTGETDAKNKAITEEFGFFWGGHQSVLPPSSHPETDGYYWVHSPHDVEIAPIPDKLLAHWQALINPPVVTKKTVCEKPTKVLEKANADIKNIPLERFLTIQHRLDVDGVAEPGRNVTGASLARDLIGVANLGAIKCDYKDKNYTLTIVGDAEDLFNNYCDSCSPIIDGVERQKIWNSAQKADGEPCIRDEEMLKNCARSYLKEVLPKVGRPSKAPRPNVLNKNYQEIALKFGIKLSDAGLDIFGLPNSKLLKLKLDLFDSFANRIEFNEMSREIELDRTPIDINLAKDFVSTNLEYDSSTENCIIALNVVAIKCKYHPVREYLNSLRGKPTDLDLLANIPARYFGNDDPLQNRLFYRKLIASVARVMAPGTKDDSLLVLQGKQGAGKSTALKALAGDDWFNDDLRSLDDKDEIAKLSRFWLLELAEVDYLFGKKEVELFKRFLSCTEDAFRPPYGRGNILVKRSCGLFATTNKSEFLTDPTGDRRYWVVEVKQDIDIASIRQHRDLIWATALAAYEDGQIHYLDSSEETLHVTANTQWRDDDPWADTILPKLGGLLKRNGSIEYITVQLIMDTILQIPLERQDKRYKNRIGAALQAAGFAHREVRIDGKRYKVWGREIHPPHPPQVKKDVGDGQPHTGTASPTSPTSHLSLNCLDIKLINDKNIKLKKKEENKTINLIKTDILSKVVGGAGDVGDTTPNPDKETIVASPTSAPQVQKDVGDYITPQDLLILVDALITVTGLDQAEAAKALDNIKVVCAQNAIEAALTAIELIDAKTFELLDRMFESV